MSTAIATTLANVPAHIAQRIQQRQQSGAQSAVAAAVIGDGGNTGPRISIKASRYRLVEDGVETVVGITLDTIIVGANPRVSKVFYAKAYDAGAENVRPDCASTDGIKPDASIANPVASNCTTCPHNVLGSKINPGTGAKSKLCADTRHLAVVPAADPTKVYSLTVPVSGMKGLREYFKGLVNYGINPEEVITELGFDPSTSYPKITFTQKGYVPANAVARVDALVDSDEVKLATRVIAPQQATALPAPAPAAAPAVDDAYDDQVPAAPAPAPAPARPAAPVAAAPAAAPAAPARPAKPAVAQVADSKGLGEKLDSLFG